MASTDPSISQQEIISTYRQMNSEMQSLIQQLTKAEMERNEHRYVQMMLRACRNSSQLLCFEF